MRAAVELGRDGHQVVLLERGPTLGGQLLRARRVPGRESVDLLLQDLLRDLGAVGVDVRLDTPATADTIRAEGADEVVIATGARAPLRTSLAVGGTWVDGVPDNVVDAFTALDDPAALGRCVVVDSDGTAYASGVVLSLLGGHGEVEVVTAFESLFPHVGSGYDRQILLESLGAEAGFRRRVQHVAEAWGAGELTVRDALTGARTVVRGVDTIVAVEPRESVLPAGLDVAARVIGDALAPRTIDAAIFDAVEVAYAPGNTNALRR
jgi:hypothetical protein